MKNNKLAAVMAAVLCVACSVPSMAAQTGSGQEPEVVITTDKSEYTEDEKIVETVIIKNVTSDRMEDIQIEADIPEGYCTDSGKESPEKWIYGISNITSGKESQKTVVFSKKPVKQTGGENNNQNGKPDNKKNTTTSSTTKKNPAKTGDTTPIGLWMVVLSAALILVFVLIRRKKGKKIFTLLLTVMIAGSVLHNGELSVSAAGQKSENVRRMATTVKEVTAGGKKVNLSVKITYSMVPEKDNIQDMEKELSYDGYKLMWEDQFNGDSLDMDDWNIETHEPGWVNNELQEYTTSAENIYMEDGNLVLKPIKSTDENGKVFYTSGRVNTQNKHDFKYGIFEARAKVPAGQGFLPAFWMMPTNENLYGQWPRCGEIDIMEVLGNQTDTSYGTIHYGNPHSESQGSYTLNNGNFADEYHTFSVEWEPGKISWYVDGKCIHTENDWYSVTEGQGEITYPAPFDQPFYMILNLAVGGNWPGNPDDTTDFDKAAYVIDYVKAYQKESYDENVTKPEKEVILRDPDAKGNYIVNGDFKEKEDLADEKNWIFMTALGGEAEAQIDNGEMIITTTNAGTADYSVQLVQPDLPLQKGGTYKVSFDAYAKENRTMKIGVTAPDRGYKRYLDDTSVELSEEKQNYTFEFTMKDKNDANGRLEFNLGNTDSTAEVRISNVSMVKTAQADDKEEEKTVLADGNLVYNGKFQEGVNRLGYWEITAPDNAQVSVTNENNVRRLQIKASQDITESNPILISQKGLALSAGTNYAMSFMAEGENGKCIQATVGGNNFQADLTGKEEAYSYKFTMSDTSVRSDQKDLVFTISQPGTFYLDEVRIVEDTLIKNGSFNAGMAGYEPYVDSSADASWVVDSLTEDNAADFTINDTGDAAWKIQLKQNHVELEKGQWYKLSLQAKSNVDRKLMFAIQRDGSADDNWTPYSGEKIVDLSGDYQTYEILFQMKHETDLNAIMSISMGAVGGKQITQKHRICIDNINLEKTEAPVIEDKPEGENLLKNGNFANGKEGWENAVTAPGEASVSFEGNRAVYDITNVGTADWNVQLKQNDITLEKGCTYRVTFKAESTKARTIKLAMLSADYDWYGGADIALEENQTKDVEVEFIMEKDTDANTAMVVSMGMIEGNDTPESVVTLSDFSLVKTSKLPEDVDNKEDQDHENPEDLDSDEKFDGNLLKNGNFANKDEGWENAVTAPGEASVSFEGNRAVYDITNVGTADWNVQLKQNNITLEKGCTYRVTFKAESTKARAIKLAMLSADYDWYGGADIALEENQTKDVEVEFTMEKDTDANTTMVVSMGMIEGSDTPESVITLSDFSVVKVKD